MSIQNTSPGSVDYRSLGVNDICEIKIKKSTGQPVGGKKDRKGTLTKSLIRKIYEIVDRAQDPKSAIPDIAYLTARNYGFDPKAEKELYNFTTILIKLITKGLKKEEIMDYLKGAVMAVYVIEEAGENNPDLRSLLNCGGGKKP